MRRRWPGASPRLAASSSARIRRCRSATTSPGRTTCFPREVPPDSRRASASGVSSRPSRWSNTTKRPSPRSRKGSSRSRTRGPARARRGRPGPLRGKEARWPKRVAQGATARRRTLNQRVGRPCSDPRSSRRSRTSIPETSPRTSPPGRGTATCSSGSSSLPTRWPYSSSTCRPSSGSSRAAVSRNSRPAAAPPAAARVLGAGRGVAAATDVAEVIGGAIALNLLFGLPLLVGRRHRRRPCRSACSPSARRGQRPFEFVVFGDARRHHRRIRRRTLRPPGPWTGAAAGLVPRFEGSGSLLLAASMLGATVMPHAIYLHSALARDRHGSDLSGASSGA